MKHAWVFSYLNAVFCAFLLCSAYAQQPPPASYDPFLAALEQGQSIPLDTFPVIKDLDLPTSIRTFLHSLAIISPHITRTSYYASFITGGVIFKGIPIEIRLRLTQADEWSLLLALPAGFRFSQIDPRLSRLNQLNITKAFLVFSTAQSYLDPAWNITVEPGTNLILNIGVSGALESLLSVIPGISVKEIQVAGSLKTDLVGSSFKVHLPGTLKLGSIGESVGLILAIYFKKPPLNVKVGSYELVTAIQTGFRIKLPKQTDTISFLGEITLTQMRKISVSAFMVGFWENAFGISGLGIGELGFLVGQDLAVAAVSAGTIPVSEICLQGGIKLGKHRLGLTGCFDLSMSDWLLAGELAGGLYLSDLVDFSAEMIARAARKLGAKNYIVNEVGKRLPPIGLKKIKMYVVPNANTYVLGKNYDRGVTAEVTMDLFGKEVGLSAITTDKKLVGQGYIEEFKVGPLRFGGIAGEYLKYVPENAAAVSLQIDPYSKHIARLFMDGLVGLTIPAIGEIGAATRIELGVEGLVMQFYFKLFQYFDAAFKVWGVGPISPMAQSLESTQLAAERARRRALYASMLNNRAFVDHAEALQYGIDLIDAGDPLDLNNIKSWGIHVRLRQAALQQLSGMLKQYAQSLIVNARKTMSNARTSIRQLDQKLAAIDAEIAQKGKEIDSYEIANKASLDVAIAEAEKAKQIVHSLDELKQELDEQIAKCAGSLPKEARTAENLAQIAPVSQEQQRVALAEYLEQARFGPQIAERMKKLMAAAAAQKAAQPAAATVASAKKKSSSFNPFSTSDWQDLGSSVGGWFQSSYYSLWDKTKQIGECAKVVPLGAEWGMKKASYEIAVLGVDAAQVALEGVKTLQAADPRLVPLRAEIAALAAQREGWRRLRNGGLNAVAATQGIATATGTIGIGIATIAQKGVDLRRVELKVSLDQLARGKIQRFGLTLGDVDFDAELDLAKGAYDTAKSIFYAILKRRFTGL